MVHVVNLNNGERLETYVISESADQILALNGPAARKGCIGDQIFILSYAAIEYSDQLTPTLIDLNNND